MTAVSTSHAQTDEENNSLTPVYFHNFQNKSLHFGLFVDTHPHLQRKKDTKRLMLRNHYQTS